MQLLHARGELEALIDFSEDQHFDESPRALASNVAQKVTALLEQIRAHRENAVRGEMLRSGISVALLGAPNAGKSSLLNRIVGREAAIVSREAGTTRDVVEVGVDLAGWYVKFGDMAGLRSGNVAKAAFSDVNTVGEVENEGIRRAKERALRSDVVIVVLAIETQPEDGRPVLHIDPEVVETARKCLAQGRAVVVAINKIDKLPHLAEDGARAKIITAWESEVRAALQMEAGTIFPISCRSETEPQASPQTRPRGSVAADPGNIQALLRGLTDTFSALTQPLLPDCDPGTGAGVHHQMPDMSILQDSLGASERQRLLLEECMGHLETFLAQVVFGSEMPATAMIRLQSESDSPRANNEDFDIVVAAESLRAAADCVAKITGRGEGGDVEEVLGVVFEK